MNITTTKLDEIYDAIISASPDDYSTRSIAKSQIRALIYDTFNECMQEAGSFDKATSLFLERVGEL